MAVDAYYQVSPTFAFGAIGGDYDSNNDGVDEVYVFPILNMGLVMKSEQLIALISCQWVLHIMQET